MKRVKRIEWVSLVVDVAIMSVAISRDSSRVFSSSSRLARFARSPVLLLDLLHLHSIFRLLLAEQALNFCAAPSEARRI